MTHKAVVALVILIWVFSEFLSSISLWSPTNIIYVMFSTIVFACIISTTYFSVKIYLNIRRHMNQIQVLQIHQAAQNGEMANVIRLRKFAIAARGRHHSVITWC